VGYPKKGNAVILVKRLNREKFCPGATSFLGTGSSVYIAGIETFGSGDEDALDGVTSTQWFSSRLRKASPQPIKRVSSKNKICTKTVDLAKYLIDKTLNENSASAPKF
jgi:hypothetical protein